MCKLAGISSLSGFAPVEIAEFVRVFHACSVPHAMDGFGFAFRRGDGLSVSKWEEPEDFVTAAEVFAGFAAKSPLIVHARRATGQVSFANTHPFVDAGVALVHNGVVHRPGRSLRLSSCDSEHLLQAFIDGGQAEIERSVLGYYAYLAIDNTGALHVARDDRAPLWVLALPNRGAFVFATDEEFLQSLPWQGEIAEVAPLTYRCVCGTSVLNVRRFAAPAWRRDHCESGGEIRKLADVAFSRL